MKFLRLIYTLGGIMITAASNAAFSSIYECACARTAHGKWCANTNCCVSPGDNCPSKYDTLICLALDTSECANWNQDMEEQWCNWGEYWDSGAGTCKPCPSPGTSWGDSSALASGITECFIQEGTAFKDTTGDGVYTEDCYYKLPD